MNKSEQKKILSEIMQEDEKLGLYDNLPMSAEEYFKAKYPHYTMDSQEILDIKEYSNYLLYHHINVLAERIAEKADIEINKKSNYGTHRKWQKVKGEEVDLFEYQTMYKVDKNSIREIAKDYINELNLQSSK